MNIKFIILPPVNGETNYAITHPSVTEDQANDLIKLAYGQAHAVTGDNTNFDDVKPFLKDAGFLVVDTLSCVGALTLKADETTKTELNVSKMTYIPKFCPHEGQIEMYYNPHYEQHAKCECGHPYHRHFDSHENMIESSCKYCRCREFKLAKAEDGQ